MPGRGHETEILRIDDDLIGKCNHFFILYDCLPRGIMSIFMVRV
jgi:hypothetical protein